MEDNRKKWHRLSFYQRLKAYKLLPSILVMAIVFVIFVISFFVYNIPGVEENSVASNLLLAIFTSLLVTVFTMLVDIIVEYKKHKNEVFFEDMQQFGIESMSINKEELIMDYLPQCDEHLWISGYRLILTYKLRKEFCEAIGRGAELSMIICPPWTDAFKMVYGNTEKVMQYYLGFLESVCKQIKNGDKRDLANYRVRFINKPIFSDTYRLDGNLISGPYMHNPDSEYRKMMARLPLDRTMTISP